MSSDIQALADTRTMPTYRRLPVTFVRGEGVRLYDDAGKDYLDFVAGVAVNALGHAHPAVTSAIAEQAGTLVHTSNLYYTGPMARLADRLCGLLGWGDGRVFFANSGAEANECALKLVRRWAGDKFGSNRYGTIAAWGAFHGRTLQTLAATGQPAKWNPFHPLPLGFTHVEYDHLRALEDAVTGAESSVLLEPIQGEAGVMVPTDGYLEHVRRICDEHDLALIIDEVQTGLGRTGKWFGYQHSRAVPDVITLAKALGNGLPVGACVARGEWAEAFQLGDHATTIGGGPVVCAAALAVIDTIEQDGLVDNARSVGAYLKQRLEEMTHRHQGASNVRGRGLLLALQFDVDCARDVVLACLKKGLLVNDVSPSAIRMCPPLILTKADCDEAIEILDGVLARVPQVLPA